jgi:hypothetical protein
MLFFWGLVGIFNSIFLPGAALCSLIAPSRIIISKFLGISLVFSLIINYILALLLIIPGFYTRSVMISLFLLYLLIIFLRINNIKLNLTDEFNNKKLNLENNKVDILRIKVIKNICYCCFVIVFFSIFLFYHGFIFKTVDTIMNWNAWAVEWASNSYPRTLGDYPQMMPIIMGLPYLFMGQEIPEIFTILSLEIIVLIGLITFYTLKSSQFSYGSLVAVVGTAWLFIVTRVGIADALVGVLALMAWTMAHWAVSESESRKEKLFLYAAFSAAAAAATIKQSGLFWWPFFIGIVFEKYKLKDYDKIKILKQLLIPIILSIIIIVPWYLYNKYLIYTGKVSSMTQFFLTSPDLLRGRSLFGRAGFAIFKYFYYTVFSLAAIWGLKRSGLRVISASCLFLMVGWALFFSYGSGNIKFPVMLAFFPLGGYIKTIIDRDGHLRIWSGFINLINNLKNSFLAFYKVYLISFLLVLLGICSYFSSKIDQGLLNIHDKNSLKLGLIGLTRRVDYLEKRNPQKIVSGQDQLKQLRSIPKNLYKYTDGSLPDNFLDYGYLVVNKKYLNTINKNILYDNFYEDYYEDNFYLFINKKLNIFDFQYKQQQ